MPKLTVFVLPLFVATAAFAQSGKQMTNEQLVQLTANGVTLKLGGEGMGYAGNLKLSRDGKGKGSATTDGGGKVSLSGTWKIKDGMFCRTWKEHNNGKEVCETWYLTSGNSVEVYNGKEKIGVNSW